MCSLGARKLNMKAVGFTPFSVGFPPLNWFMGWIINDLVTIFSWFYFISLTQAIYYLEYRIFKVLNVAVFFCFASSWRRYWYEINGRAVVMKLWDISYNNTKYQERYAIRKLSKHCTRQRPDKSPAIFQETISTFINVLSSKFTDKKL